MIHCRKCKHQNDPNAQKCSNCGANLLPGMSLGGRLLIFGIAILVGILFPVITFRTMTSDPGGDVLEVIKSMGVTICGGLIGLAAILFGIFWLFRKTPLQERYQDRAQRHKDLDPLQAIVDYTTALEFESIKGKKALTVDATDIYIERGKLYRNQDKEAEAMADFESALNRLNMDISNSTKWETSLRQNKLEVSHLLGQPNPELEVLSAVIRAIQRPGKDEESTKYRGDALQTLTTITLSGEFGIVGYCSKCGREVPTEATICKNNINHKEVSNPHAVRMQLFKEESPN